MSSIEPHYDWQGWHDAFPRINEGKSLRRMLRVIMAITLLRALWVIMRFPIMLVGFWALARAGRDMYFGKNG